MDPLHPWIDADEVRRLAARLMKPSRDPDVSVADAGFDEGFVGFAANRPAAATPAPPPVSPPPPPPAPVQTPVTATRRRTLFHRRARTIPRAHPATPRLDGHAILRQRHLHPRSRGRGDLRRERPQPAALPRPQPGPRLAPARHHRRQRPRQDRLPPPPSKSSPWKPPTAASCSVPSCPRRCRPPPCNPS